MSTIWQKDRQTPDTKESKEAQDSKGKRDFAQEPKVKQELTGIDDYYDLYDPLCRSLYEQIESLIRNTPDLIQYTDRTVKLRPYDSSVVKVTGVFESDDIRRIARRTKLVSSKRISTPVVKLLESWQPVEIGTARWDNLAIFAFMAQERALFFHYQESAEQLFQACKSTSTTAKTRKKAELRAAIAAHKVFSFMEVVNGSGFNLTYEVLSPDQKRTLLNYIPMQSCCSNQTCYLCENEKRSHYETKREGLFIKAYWLLRAAQLGMPEAQYNLALLLKNHIAFHYESKKTEIIKLGIQWMIQAAEQGFFPAIFQLNRPEFKAWLGDYSNNLQAINKKTPILEAGKICDGLEFSRYPENFFPLNFKYDCDQNDERTLRFGMMRFQEPSLREQILLLFSRPSGFDNATEHAQHIASTMDRADPTPNKGGKFETKAV